ncbi:phage T7 F exclusion suppressor FxsA [Aquimixticola soesokkakensis]|uniref:Phage T7 F exclusion suppressor FxsA n=1 Tax=Aquimixticola soesokkakensis TaxID=1519096 RepID=A0A1Y5R8Y4_9RHOB|nr:FxsA family protein [Aquimixticola soesokkakensis]SLN11877.1 phage T7 F exclusion suppressor FxsA [Aquimixticola soesokkakensis]
MWLFLAFVAVPVIEIALFVQVGGLIGLGPTLAIVILTAILGTYMVRQQGALALAQLRGSLNTLQDPTEPLAHGAMVLVSGVLLLTPGFFTDAVGFALLIPPVRSAVFQFLRKRVKVQSFAMGQQTTYHTGDPFRENPAQGTVIDGEFEEIEPAKSPTHDPKSGPSGWTRH